MPIRRVVTAVMGVVLLLSAASQAAAWDWPAPAAALSLSFGMPTRFGFAAGVAFVPGTVLSTSRRGDIVYEFDERDWAGEALRLPFAAVVAVAHGNNWFSLYTDAGTPGASDASRPSDGGGFVEGRTPLVSAVPQPTAGIRGASAAGERVAVENGRAPEPGFRIFDQAVNRFVNPQLVLPTVADTSPPVVTAVRIQVRNAAIVLADAMVVPTGRALLQIAAFDQVPNSRPTTRLWPIRLAVRVNGRLLRAIDLTTSESFGDLRPMRSVGAGDRAGGRSTEPLPFELGEITVVPGPNEIEVVSEDAYRNRRAMRVTFEGRTEAGVTSP